MEKAKGFTVVLLMGYIFIGAFVILYNFLIWQTFSKVFSYTLLIALVLLKGSVMNLQQCEPVNELNEENKINLAVILKVSLLIFLAVLFVSYLYKGQHPAALITFLLAVFTAVKAKTATRSTH